MQNARVREVVATIDREMSRLLRRATAEKDRTETDGLIASWVDLVKLLEPAPEVRECPACGQTVMRTATRCGYCWEKLSPPVEA